MRTRASGTYSVGGGEHLGVDLLVDPAQRRLGAEDLPLDLAGFLGSEVDAPRQGLGPPAAPHDEVDVVDRGSGGPEGPPLPLSP